MRDAFSGTFSGVRFERLEQPPKAIVKAAMAMLVNFFALCMAFVIYFSSYIT